MLQVSIAISVLTRDVSDTIGPHPVAFLGKTEATPLRPQPQAVAVPNSRHLAQT